MKKVWVVHSILRTGWWPFSVVDIVEEISSTKAGNYIGGHLIVVGWHLRYCMAKHRVPNPEMISFTK